MAGSFTSGNASFGDQNYSGRESSAYGGDPSYSGGNDPALIEALIRQNEAQAQRTTQQQTLASARGNPIQSVAPAPGMLDQLMNWLGEKDDKGIPTGANLAMPTPLSAIIHGAPVVGDALTKGYTALNDGMKPTPSGINTNLPTDEIDTQQYHANSQYGTAIPTRASLFGDQEYLNRGEDYVRPQYGVANNQYYNTAGASPAAVPFNEVLGGQQDDAMARILQHLMQQGLGADQYGGQFRTELEGINVPEGTTDFSQYFPSNVGQQLEDSITERTRNEFGQQFEEFAPTGFEFDKFGSTSDDAIIDDILNKRFGEALSPLKNAQARGNLGDQGYNFGVSQLNDQRAGATTTLGETGTSVLDRYRGNLTDIATEGRQAAGNFTLGQDFNPQTYSDRIDTTVGELGGNLRGDITNAIGPNPLFDISGALQKAGTNQGAVNETRPLYDVLARKSEARQGSRGLGTQGVF